MSRWDYIKPWTLLARLIVALTPTKKDDAIVNPAADIIDTGAESGKEIQLEIKRAKKK